MQINFPYVTYMTNESIDLLYLYDMLHVQTVFFSIPWITEES